MTATALAVEEPEEPNASTFASGGVVSGGSIVYETGAFALPGPAMARTSTGPAGYAIPVTPEITPNVTVTVDYGDGDEMTKAIVKLLREYIRAKGGNVQDVLGS